MGATGWFCSCRAKLPVAASERFERLSIWAASPNKPPHAHLRISVLARGLIVSVWTDGLFRAAFRVPRKRVSVPSVVRDKKTAKERERLLKELGTFGDMIRGTLVHTQRRCGRKGCPCMTGGAFHDVRYLTISTHHAWNPSEWVVQHVLRKTFPELLADAAHAPNWAKFIRERMDFKRFRRSA